MKASHSHFEDDFLLERRIFFLAPYFFTTYYLFIFYDVLFFLSEFLFLSESVLKNFPIWLALKHLRPDNK